MSRFHTYGISVILIFHIIGTYLFLTDQSASELSYINISLCALVIFLTEKHRSIQAFLIIASGGFLLEWIGVQTGYLFGDYQYESALGTKILGVPLVIGLNWYAVIVSSTALSKTLKFNTFTTALIAATLCTLLDFLIEPVAIKFNFWSWSGNHIPVFNYICWFVFSFVFALVYLKKSKGINYTAIALYFIWIAFFSILNLA